MTSKNIIIAGAVAIGIYILSQTKKIPFIVEAQKTVRRSPSAATPTVRQRTTQKVAQKVAPKRIGQPTTQAARIAAAQRKAAATKAWIEHARKNKAQKAAQRKAAVRKAAAQKIGKKIGKTVAQKIAQKIKARRAAMARYAKKQRPRIQRPNMYKKQTNSKLFPGAEKSRIIPYSESSKHSYYGSKSHKVLNPGYMEKRYKADQKQAQDARIEELRAMFPLSNL